MPLGFSSRVDAGRQNCRRPIATALENRGDWFAAHSIFVAWRNARPEKWQTRVG
jgi:hypothetical protein